MPAWTPPVIIGRSRHAADRELFGRLGLDDEKQAYEKQANIHWILTRDDNEEAPLKLVRPDKVYLSVDFSTGKARYRTTESGKGAQALSKALGIKQFYRMNNAYPLIIDATGGLGQDAWALASIGCSVIIIERHPVVHALLQDGLFRAGSLSVLAASDSAVHARIASRLTLVHDDATRCLRKLCDQHRPHAIYLDPMYPERRKKASSKKGMQFLHALLGPPTSEECPELLLCATDCRASRVAVKRPAGAQLLAGSDSVNAQLTAISTPNTRFDIYHQL